MVDTMHTAHSLVNIFYQPDILHYQFHMMAHNTPDQIADVLCSDILWGS